MGVTGDLSNTWLYLCKTPGMWYIDTGDAIACLFVLSLHAAVTGMAVQG